MRERQRPQEGERHGERPPAEHEAAPGGVDLAELPGSQSRRGHAAMKPRHQAPVARRIAALLEPVPMASRSPRVFNAQFHLLLVTSQLERSEARLNEAAAEGHRLRAWRAARDVDRLWDAVEEQRRRLVQPAWRLADPRPRPTGLEPRELLHSRLQGYVRSDAVPERGRRRGPCRAAAQPRATSRAACRKGPPSPASPRSPSPSPRSPRSGIGQRPSLIVAEVCRPRARPVRDPARLQPLSRC